MGHIKRIKASKLQKFSALFTGAMVVFLSSIQYSAGKREFILGIIGGIVVILFALFSKVKKE